MEYYFYIYLLRCNDGSYYIGHTDQLEKRLAEHCHKKYSGYTSTRLPITCVYVERFSSREEAKVAEKKIKGWSQAKKEALIDENWKLLIELSNQKK